MTRRQWLEAMVQMGAAGAAAGQLFAAADFWNRKPVGEWTSAEIVQLLAASPWARTLNIAVAVGGIAAGAANPALQSGQRDPSTSAGGAPPPPLEDRKRRSGPARGSVVVRWESAPPVRDALRTRLPEEFADHYVISVEGIDTSMLVRPNSRDGEAPDLSPEEQASRLKDGARLAVKGRDSLPAGVIDAIGRVRRTWRFGFARELLPISASDRDLVFSIKAGGVRFQVDFKVQDMRYKGTLAL